MNQVNITALKERIPELLAVHREKSDANLKYTAAVEAISELTFVEKPILKKIITALTKDKCENERAAADELSELLGELKEFAGSEE